jgi:hypothetical protein
MNRPMTASNFRDGANASSSVAANCTLSCPAAAARRLATARGLLGAVDAEHRAGRADQIGGQQRNVADPGADIEHAHSRRDPGATQDVFGEVAEELALEFQPNA